MKYLIYRVIIATILVTVLATLTLVSCTNKSRLEPLKDSYIIQLKFYNSLTEVRKVCGKDTSGCLVINNNLNTIHSIKSRCVVSHELEHVYYEKFHGTQKATCRVLNN